MKTILTIAFFFGMVLSCNEESPGFEPNLEKKLSSYEFFSDLVSILENPNEIATTNKKWVPILYQINSPLFSDATDKTRVIFLPNGTKIKYKDSQVFGFPQGTIVTKTFRVSKEIETLSFPSESKLETRLLLNSKEGWKAVSYIWNKEGTDATISYSGENIPLVWEGKEFQYAVPSKNQCASCHQVYEGREPKLVPIGLQAMHLHNQKSSPSPLQTWKEKGVLRGLPWWGIPELADYRDTSLDLESRARAYLEIQCAHCHREEAAAGMNSKLVLSVGETNYSNLGVCKTPGSAGKGGGNQLKYDIVPGRPEESILLYRMETMDAGAKMPQLGRAIPHKEGIALIREWIANMEPKDCSKIF